MALFKRNSPPAPAPPPSTDPSVIVGTEGDNTIVVAGSTPVKIYGLGGHDVLTGGGGGDIVDGGAGGDYVYDEAYVSGASNDTVDTLIGGDGDDRLYAYNGADSIDAGAGNDAIDVYGSGAQISGGAGNDGITARGDNVRIDGGDGADNTITYGNNLTIDAGAGDDRLSTDAISLQADGGEGVDTVQFQYQQLSVDFDVDFSGTTVTVMSGGTVSNFERYQVYSGDGNDRLALGQNSDFVNGGGGKDTILGGAGNDFVAGDANNDVLTGGAGADSFAYGLVGDFQGGGAVTLDHVTDFNVAEGDVLDFSALGLREDFATEDDVLAAERITFVDAHDGVLVEYHGNQGVTTQFAVLDGLTVASLGPDLTGIFVM